MSQAARIDPKAQIAQQLAAGVTGAKSIDDQMKVINHIISDVPIKATAEVLANVLDHALDNLAFAKILLNVLDVRNFQQAIDKKVYEQLFQVLKSSEKGRPVAWLLERASDVPKESVNLLRAKITMYFQLLSLIKDRADEDGLPPIKLTAMEAVKTVLESPELSDRTFTVDLNWINRLYWSIVTSILEEADFHKKGQTFEMILSDVAIRKNAAGTGLAQAGGAEAGVGGLSDVVVARMGQNIIRRITLLVRMLSMYPMDHPSVEPAIETMVSTLDELLTSRQRITLSRVGADILVDDIRIKKRSKFLDDFVAALDQRNINAVTFNRGITLDEVKSFIRIFGMTEAQMKKAGGAKSFLDTQHVSNIAIDQFRYGVIAGEDLRIAVADSRDSDDRLMANIILSEVVGKMKAGTDLSELSAEKIGQAFKQIANQDMRSDPTARRYLMQMVLAMDPSLLDKALFGEGGIKDELSWSTTRKMVDQLLHDVVRGNLDTKLAALDSILNMADIAIARQKDTTLVQIIDALMARLSGKEADHEVINKTFETLGKLAQKMIVSDRLLMAQRVVLGFDRLRRKHEASLGQDGDNLADKIMVDSAISGLRKVADEETVSVMLRNLTEEDREHAEAVARILRVLGSEPVINGLFSMFADEDRSIRRKVFTILSDMGEPALEISRWKIREVGNDKTNPRYEKGKLGDTNYFVIRNAIDLVAKLGNQEDAVLLKESVRDRDARVRRAALNALSTLSPKDAVEEASGLLLDGDQDVSETSALVLSKLRATDQVPKLIEKFYSESEMRKTLVSALAKLGGDEALAMLEPAGQASLFQRKNMAVFYRENPELRIAAIKGLGEAGGEKQLTILKRFYRRFQTPILRLIFVPLGDLRHRRKFVQAARDAIARLEYRLHGKK